MTAPQPTHERARAALQVIDPTGAMQTVDGSVPAHMLDELLDRAENVEPGPLRMVLVVPRPGLDPHIIGRPVTAQSADTLRKMIKGRSASTS